MMENETQIRIKQLNSPKKTNMISGAVAML